jgi:hypothetical protein
VLQTRGGPLVGLARCPVPEPRSTIWAKLEHFMDEIDQKGVCLRIDEWPQRYVYLDILTDVIGHFPITLESISSAGDFVKDASECPNINSIVERGELQELGGTITWSSSPRFAPHDSRCGIACKSKIANLPHPVTGNQY